MISSATEYMFVSFDKDIEVDGAIMPIRADKSILRGVDVGFLMEGVLERLSVLTGSAGHIDVGTGIMAERLQHCASQLVEMQPYAVLPDASFSMVQAGPYDHPRDAYPAAFVQLASMSSNPAAFVAGNQLLLSHVMNLFSDMQKLRRLIKSRDVSGMSGSFSFVSAGSASYGQPDYLSTGTIYLWYGTTTRTGATSYRQYAPSSSSSIHFVPPGTDLVGGCPTILFKLRVGYSDASAGQSFTKRCFMPVQPEKSGNAYVVNYATLMNMISSARIFLGAVGNKYPPSSGSQRSNVNTVSIEGIYPVVDLTDHTNQE